MTNVRDPGSDSDSNLPGHSGANGDSVGEEWIRSEERSRTGTKIQESGRVHLSKRVVTTPESVQVPVTREELTVDRQAIDDPDGFTDPDATIADRDYEIILHTERLVVTKVVVPVERIRIAVRAVQSEETVTADLRSEHIDIDQTGIDQAPPPRTPR